MYVPKHFALDDQAAIAGLMAEHAFALLVTCEAGVATASHIPLLHDPAPDGPGALRGHIARANPQCRLLQAAADAGREVLAVFQGPHAYVSPNDYGEGPPTVPTWNYQAIHCYGVPRPLTDKATVGRLLADLTARHEYGRAPAWSPTDLAPDFLEKMQRGVFAFEIPIARLEAKAKLSQNRAPAQAARAAAALQTAQDPLAQETGRAMARALEAGT